MLGVYRSMVSAFGRVLSWLKYCYGPDEAITREVPLASGPAVSSDATTLRRALQAACDRQAERELASGHDAGVGVMAVSRAREAIRAVPEEGDAAAQALAIVDVLFALLARFRRDGPRGEHASAASSLGSLILALADVMEASGHGVAAAEIDRRWQVVTG